MTKREIRNIINNGWSERRAKVLEERKKNCERAKEWKLKEKENLNVKKREKHYIKPKPSTGVSKESTVTLSLLVAVTYARPI